MAKYLSNIDLSNNELQNAVIHPLGTAPSGPSEGQVYYNTGQDKIYIYNGSAWVSIAGDITEVQSATTGQLTVSNGTGPIPSLSIVTGAVTNGGTALATGDQIYDFVLGLGYSTTTGTVTSVAISGTDGIDVDSGSPITTSGTITLGLSNVPNTSLANSSITIGDSTIALGGTDTTLTGLTDIDLTAGSKTIFDGVGANTLTIGAATTTIAIPGDLVVTGTTTTNNVEVVSTSNGVIFEGNVADNNEGTLLAGTLTADRTYTLPDATGTVALTSDIVTDITSREFAVDLDAAEASVTKSVNTYTVTHGLSGRDVMVEIYDTGTYETVYADIARPTTGTVTVSFAQAVTDGSFRVLIKKIG